MLLIIGLLHNGHEGRSDWAISSRIQALQFSPLHLHTGTGVVSGFCVSFIPIS